MSSLRVTALHGTGDGAVQLPDGVSVSGVGTIPTLKSTSALFAGISTADASGINVTGVMTATTFSGNLSGTGVTATTFTGALTGNVTGSATGLTGSPDITTGDVTVGTASSIFVGDNGAHVREHSIGVGTTSTTGKNAGVGTNTGTIVWDSSLEKLQVYSGDSSGWVDAAEVAFEATGGTKSTTDRSGWAVHTFTGSGAFTVASSSATVEYFIIGAGGGGQGGTPATGGGGGGAGALYFGTQTVNPGPYTVTVGAGSPAANGDDSVFGTITAEGGGRGSGYSPGTGGDGGSGGGGAYAGGPGEPLSGPGGEGSGATGGTAGATSPTDGFGNDGGSGTIREGGGGGGASAAGQNANP